MLPMIVKDVPDRFPDLILAWILATFLLFFFFFTMQDIKFASFLGAWL